MRVWDLRSGEVEILLRGHKDAVNSLAILPDGRIVSGSSDKSVRVWDIEGESEAVITLRKHQGIVYSVAVLPGRDGGVRLVSGSGDKTVRVWDLQTQSQLEVLGHEACVWSVACLPDGRIVSGAADSTVRIWDLNTWHVLTFSEHEDVNVNSVSVLPDGKVVSAADDNTVRVWDVAEQTSVVLRGHKGDVRSVAVLPDGKIVSGSHDSTLKVWDPTSGTAGEETLRGHAGHVMSVAALPDGRILSGGGRTVKVWDLRKPATPNLAHKGNVNCIAALPDCSMVVTGSEDATVRVWDTAGRSVVLRGHEKQVRTVTVSRTATTGHVVVISGSDDKSVRVWNVESGTSVVLKGHDDYVRRVAILPDGRVVSAGGDKSVRVWNVATGQCDVLDHEDWVWDIALPPERSAMSHTAYVRSKALLPDGRVVSGSEDFAVRVWNADAGAEETVLTGHKGRVWSVCALADGRVVSGSGDRTVRVWNLETLEATHTFFHDDSVRYVAVGTDGRVVAGCDGNRVRAWDLETSKVQCLTTSPGAFDVPQDFSRFDVGSGSQPAGIAIRQVHVRGRSAYGIAGNVLHRLDLVSATGDDLAMVSDAAAYASSTSSRSTEEGSDTEIDSKVKVIDPFLVPVHDRLCRSTEEVSTASDESSSDTESCYRRQDEVH